LGAVWIGIYPREERIKGIKNLLSLPEDILPVSLVAIGYPAEKKEAENRYKPERVHHNRW
jgi:nitroreductase